MAEHFPMWRGHCPRCDVDRVTFDIRSWPSRGAGLYKRMECFLVCRHCYKSSIFLLEKDQQTSPELEDLPGHFANEMWEEVEQVVLLGNARACPDYVPNDIQIIFDEAAKCLAINCYDASGTMFRKVVDRTTRNMLPVQPDNDDQTHGDYIAWKVRKDLKLRLEWLLKAGKIASALEPLLESVREDGNDAAHDTIGSEEAEDLQDFTVVLLETIFTVPGQVEANRVRREARRRPEN
jgi:hypothetical protein